MGEYKYSMKVSHENATFITYTVEFENNKYIFWAPKNRISSKVINVYFDNNIKEVPSDLIGVSLNGIIDIKAQKQALDILKQIMKTYGIDDVSYNFNPNSDEQKMSATNLREMLENNLEEVQPNNSLEQSQVGEKTYRVINGRIFDGYTMIGMIGQDGYTFDSNTNAIYQNGVFKGWIGDNNSNQKDNNNMTAGKGNIKSLAPGYMKEAPKYSSVSTNASGPIGGEKQLGRAAFVNLPIIIFILSLLLLISSIIILYILD